MAFLDEQGRLFGKVNLIDAAVGLFVVALVPLAYAAWALFRTPPPVIEGVSPSVVVARQANQHIVVRGRYMRPYLRASIGAVGVGYLFESPDRAQVVLPPLEAGTYDLAFFDDSKEIARFRNAVSVPPPPPEQEQMTIEAVVPRLLDYSRAPQRIDLRGQRFRESLRVLVGRQQGTFRFLSADHAILDLPPLDPGTYDLTFFDADTEILRMPNAVTMRPEALVAIRLLVRFVTRPEVLEVVRRAQQQPLKPGPKPAPPPPALLSYEVTDELVGTTKPDLREGRLTIIKAMVRVMASKSADGWQLDGKPLKAGGSFSLTAQTYVLNGDILSIEVAGVRAK